MYLIQPITKVRLHWYGHALLTTCMYVFIYISILLHLYSVLACTSIFCLLWVSVFIQFSGKTRLVNTIYKMHWHRSEHIYRRPRYSVIQEFYRNPTNISHSWITQANISCKARRTIGPTNHPFITLKPSKSVYLLRNFFLVLVTTVR